jgi:hypothetical protein
MKSVNEKNEMALLLGPPHGGRKTQSRAWPLLPTSVVRNGRLLLHEPDQPDTELSRIVSQEDIADEEDLHLKLDLESE